MEKPSPAKAENLIKLIPAIKKSLGCLSENANLGFLVKAVVTSSIISALSIAALWVILIVFSIATGASISKDLKSLPATTSSNNGFERITYNRSGFGNISEVLGERTDISTTVKPSPPSPNVALGATAGVMMAIATLGAVFLAVFNHVLFTLVSLKIYSGDLPTIKNLIKSAIAKTPKMLVLMVLAGAFTVVGYMLFVIPGIILTVMLIFAPIILLNEDTGVLAALKGSKKLTSGYKLNLYLKGLGFMILSFFALVFGFPVLYALGPLGMYLYLMVGNLTLVILYMELKNIKGNQSAVSEIPTPVEEPETFQVKTTEPTTIESKPVTAQ